MLAETNEGYRNLIKVDEQRVPRRLLLQAAQRLGAARAAPRGHHRDHRLPRRPRLAADPRRATSEAALEAAARFQDIFGRDHFFVELQDHGIRTTTSASSGRCSTSRASSARRCSRPTTATTRSKDDAEAHDALLCVQTGALKSDAKRFKFDGDDFYIKSAAEMRDLFREAPRRVRQHAADRGARRRRDRVRPGGPAGVPGARRPRRELVPARADARRARRSATASTPAPHVLERIELRARRHQVDGVLGVLPRRLGPRALREVARHPGRARAGERGRFVRRVLPAHRRHRPDQVRPAVRALPQPGPQADARHRHGLRLALPGRDDPLRRAEVRRRPRRAGHHVLHDQGPGRGARRRPRARLPVRGRRQDRQAHAAAHHGPRHAAARVLRAERQVRRRLQDGRRAAHALRRRSRRPPGDRRRASASKGCAARTASTRPRS